VSARADAISLKGAPRVAALLDEARPPEHGPLPAVREGWLLRRVEGAEPWNLLPARVRSLALLLCAGPPVALDLLSLLLEGPTGLSFFGFVLAWRFSRPLAEAFLRHRLRGRGVAASSLGALRPGTIVRVVGRVRPGPTFTSAGGGWPTVMACYFGTVTYEEAQDGEQGAGDPPRLWSEQRGIDFVVDLPSGESVLVAVRDAYVLVPARTLGDAAAYRSWDEAPAPLRRVLRRGVAGSLTEAVSLELLVEPGDEVEILGTLDLEVNPALPATPGRGVPFGPVLRGTARRPVLIRPRTVSAADEPEGDAA
jgi:hypothetical protein